MRDIFIFLLGALGGKLIEDNLPNLHYKNLVKAFNKYIAPALLVAYIGLLYITAKFTKDPEAKKNLMYTIMLLTVVTVIAKVIADKKSTEVISA